LSPASRDKFNETLTAVSGEKVEGNETLTAVSGEKVEPRFAG